TTFVAFSPVGRTLLTDRPWSRERIEGMPFIRSNPRFIEPNYTANIDATDRFRALAADMGMSAAGLAIAWTRARAPHVLPIPGTSRTEHLEELLQGVARDLTADDMARIETVLPVGWAQGDRYNDVQWRGPERYS
ncbi:MAG: aldo/keto reductase, partial [Pseudomonadota bacterium]